MNERELLLREWLEARFDDFRLRPASEDASFRRYFRIESGGQSFIVMDAPPTLENSQPFVSVASAFASLGLKVPRIHEADLKRGFMILEDFGDRLYLSTLEPGTADALYADAMAALATLQLGSRDRTEELTPYAEPMLRMELSLFDDWFLDQHLGVTLSKAELATLHSSYDTLINSILEQPVVWVHRDFHSRNLMVLPSDSPGILDFQGAVSGPITYDLVSLLRDSYICWPAEQVDHWALDYWSCLRDRGFHGLRDRDRFLRWFDLTGVQRQLKVAGIFARLYRRDGKPGYLPDIPRTLDYVLNVCRRQQDLADLGRLIEQRALPAMTARRT